ncbi:MAG: isoprenylcysteine carboxylmethyltransferase family protein [Pyrinomonadaceae bacterium]|nr:isoprenylcysteine carboxylmethyltransferase family protein [Pyrinomonadaceae bacterium]
MKIPKSAAIYFAFQGIAVLAWWILLITVPVSRKYFQMGDSETILLSFWLPDLFLLAIGSFVVSWLIVANNEFKTVALWLEIGAISYASFYCLSFAWMTDTGWLGVVAMFPAMIVSGNFGIGLTPVFHRIMFRNSKDGKTGWILAKTLTQIAIVWTLILVIFPLLIVQIEAKIGIPRFAFPFQTILGIVLFPAVSLIGLSSAYSMAKIGRGTPLPMDTASKLVVSGVYKYVRNPMAISGIGQAIVVGFILGSLLVLLYALLGGFIWQFIYRQLEEDDLQAKFGAEYETYQQKVRCWIPRFSAKSDSGC